MDEGERRLTDALVARDLAAADALAPAGFRFEIVANARTAEAAPVWRIDGPGASRIRLHPATWERHPRLILERLVAIMPMLAAALPPAPPGWLQLNLGDEGHRPGLAFCDHRPDYLLVPDAIFLAHRGYAAWRAAFARPMPWADRDPAPFWRGALTGRGDPATLPRVALVRRLRALGGDAGLADLLGADVPADLGAAPVPPERFDRYRTHVDIDGHSNSWPGLMLKLLSGGTVLKVASPFRQWYYDRLEPWRHYVPVRADLADLEDRLGLVAADPARAEAIAAAGRALALSLTCEGEIARAAPRIAAAVRRD